MKKNILTVMLLIVALLAVGCSSSEPAAEPAPEVEAVVEEALRSKYSFSFFPP